MSMHAGVPRVAWVPRAFTSSVQCGFVNWLFATVQIFVISEVEVENSNEMHLLFTNEEAITILFWYKFQTNSCRFQISDSVRMNLDNKDTTWINCRWYISIYIALIRRILSFIEIMFYTLELFTLSIVIIILQLLNCDKRKHLAIDKMQRIFFPPWVPYLYYRCGRKWTSCVIVYDNTRTKVSELPLSILFSVVVIISLFSEVNPSNSVIDVILFEFGEFNSIFLI